jgi:threonine-phosphate decarboxylase
MAVMTSNGHGGDVYAAARDLRRGVHHLLDFSASINPLGPSPAALRAIADAAPLLQHYPDPTCWDVRQALANHWQRPAEEFLVGNGSTELIHLLPEALHIQHLLVVGPTFSEYAAAMRRSGGRVSLVMGDRTEAYRPPLEQVVAAISETSRAVARRRPIDAVLLCNPNSPTGYASSAEAVMRVARRVTRRGGWCIVDETFAEYCADASILSHMLPARTIVLRSFTKFYGLPGLRVGYAVANKPTIRRMGAHQPPWSVNMLAQRAAVAALGDGRHASRSLRFMDRERTRLRKALTRLPGCILFPSAANFLLMELPAGWKATGTAAALRRKGILIRDCSQVPGLNAQSVRFAVRTRGENDRLLHALARVLRAGGS